MQTRRLDPVVDKASRLARAVWLAWVNVPGQIVAMSTVVENDHLRVAHERQLAIYRAMTPRQRLEQAMRMNQAMRELMAAGFRDRNPTWTEPQVKRAVAERILYACTG